MAVPIRETIVPDTKVRKFAAVALNVPLAGPFHYRVPEPLRDAIALGARVRVQFGRREMTGYCVDFSGTPEIEESRIKEIIRLVDKPPLLDQRMLELTRWMAAYYCCSWGEALDAVLPSGVRKRTTARTIMFVCAAQSPDDFRARAGKIENRAPRQARALRVLASTEGEITARDLVSLAEIDHSVIHALRRAGYVTIRKEKLAYDPSLCFHVEPTAPPLLTPDQDAVLKRIDASLSAGRFHVALLHGVTGSGKTEVYLQALHHVVKSGRQGIVLVPEIALTPQTVARFRARFDRVRVLHSELTERGRREEWRAIREGRVDVVIGARSAVFAPVPKLGLLVVDEEFDASFKQQIVPRYHARDVGIWRARQENALVLLGSATPSLESLHNARSGKYELLEMPRRVENLPLPPVLIQDMSKNFGRGGRAPLLSRRLHLSIETALQKNEQVILFLNRRGFHTHISCRRCGFVLRCKHCDVSMIFHQKQLVLRSGLRRVVQVARCHYCLYETQPPESCPGCGLPGIKYRGTGTERIEEILGKLFGPERVVRMDSDAMRGHGCYEKTISDFRDGKTQILLGTQMVAKGLDFPNVTLVGVVNADIILNLPDFRAAERTFQLLTQVAGRAGRSERGGHAIIQTFSPEHPCIKYAARHDYNAFARHELASRKRFGYPPFTRLARILVEGKNAQAVEQRCAGLVDTLRRAATEAAGRRLQPAACSLSTRILGPAEAPIARIKNRARWHALVKAPDSGALHQILSVLDRRRVKGVQLIIDVDPVSLL